MCIAYLSFTIHHKTKRNDADKQRMGLSSEVDPGGGLRGLQPSLWAVFKLV